jgi:hypothetical protein
VFFFIHTFAQPSTLNFNTPLYMKRLLLPVLATLCFSVGLSSQCSEFDLTMLQAIQRAEPEHKKEKVISFGFDLYATQNGNFIFNKCWKGNVSGKTIYHQKIILETAQERFSFMTLDRELFVRLRTAIEDRNGGVGRTEDPNWYVGRLFQYRFEVQHYDGHEYYKVTISNK